jgi:hypothetical protein
MYWGSLVTGVLYITVGGYGYRAAVVKHVAAARQVLLSCNNKDDTLILDSISIL